MNGAVQEKKPEMKVIRRDPDIYREDTFVRVVNQAQREKEFDSLFGDLIRKVKKVLHIALDVVTVILSLIGLGTAIWFISTVLV